MFKVQQNIIGYLLGALDENEIAQFEAELDQNPDLQARVQDAARSLQVFDSDREDIAPPPGLVESTCSAVANIRRDARVSFSRRNRELRPARNDESWSMIDVMVAASVVLVACMLFFPAIQNSRLHAQIAGCQDNFRGIGKALIEYSLHSPNETFPEIPKSGNLSFAGFYAPALIDSGLVTEQHQFFCPSASDIKDARISSIPTIQQFSAACGEELNKMQRDAGGDYTYTMGYMKGDELCGIRNQGRTHFAIMSDVPVCEIMPSKRELKRSHMNVLFECGGVRMIPLHQTSWKGESLFENDHGLMNAGCRDDDVVVGVSYARPCTD